MKLLLHTCCAPCLITFITGLDAENFSGKNPKPDLFWYNPNIHPFTEYKARRDSLAAFASEEKYELITEDEYGLRRFIGGLYSGGNPAADRCSFCYRLRLQKTAMLAAQNGYDAFSATLLVSPYQKHDLIRQTAEEFADQYGVEFFYRDFRPWYREGRKNAKDRGCYMQKYCGCIFSEEERYLKNNVL